MAPSTAIRTAWIGPTFTRYQTFYAPGYEATLIDRFHESQLPFEVIRPARSDLWLTVILPNAILFVVVAGFLWYVLRRYRGNHPPPAS